MNNLEDKVLPGLAYSIQETEYFPISAGMLVGLTLGYKQILDYIRICKAAKLSEPLIANNIYVHTSRGVFSLYTLTKEELERELYRYDDYEVLTDAPTSDLKPNTDLETSTGEIPHLENQPHKSPENDSQTV